MEPKNEAKQALKVEIKSRIEKRNLESSTKVTENKRSKISKKNLLQKFVQEKPFPNK